MEEVKFPTTIGLYKPAIVLSGLLLATFWLLVSEFYWRTPKFSANGWLPYILLMASILAVCYGFGWFLTQTSRNYFNEFHKSSLEQDEEDQKERDNLFDLVVRKFHPNSIGFDKEADFPTVTFEVEGKQRTISKMGDTYYEVVDLD